MGVDERVNEVRLRLAAACGRAGRDPSSVRILAVAKGFGPDAVREAADSGLTAIGENRVQEAAAKIPLCPGHLAWHMVGHLQRNKARPAVELFAAVHSVDSWRVLEALDRAAEEAGRSPDVLIEVNVAGESSKFGVSPEGLAELVEQSRILSRVTLRGLMTVPPFQRDPEAVRPYFRRLRELRDGLESRFGVGLPELSMGMSGDFEIAVEEGATWVRLGTAIFGTRVAGGWKSTWATDEASLL